MYWAPGGWIWSMCIAARMWPWRRWPGLAALRHGCPVVATVHLSVRHTLRPATPRGVVLRAAGGAAERWLLPGMAAVIALTPSPRGCCAATGSRPAGCT